MIQLSYGQACVAVVVLFLAAVAVVLLCLSLLAPVFLRLLDARCLPHEVRLAEYEAATAAPHQLQPEPAPVAEVVHVGEVIAAPRVDVLPPAAPSLDEVPLFASIPLTLPMGMDFGFSWVQPWTTATGAFPVIEQAEPAARERFATPAPKARRRKVTVDVGGDVRSEMAEVGS